MRSTICAYQFGRKGTNIYIVPSNKCSFIPISTILSATSKNNGKGIDGFTLVS